MISHLPRKSIGNKGEGYISSNKLYGLGRVRQYKDLCGKDDDGDDANNNEVSS